MSPEGPPLLRWRQAGGGGSAQGEPAIEADGATRGHRDHKRGHGGQERLMVIGEEAPAAAETSVDVEVDENDGRRRRRDRGPQADEHQRAGAVEDDRPGLRADVGDRCQVDRVADTGPEQEREADPDQRRGTRRALGVDRPGDGAAQAGGDRLANDDDASGSSSARGAAGRDLRCRRRAAPSRSRSRSQRLPGRGRQGPGACRSPSRSGAPRYRRGSSAASAAPCEDRQSRGSRSGLRALRGRRSRRSRRRGRR